jgi:DNA polymerase III delta prime subunit
MSMKKKQIQLRQKEQFEHSLKSRLAYLAGKGIEPPKTDKDPIVRKIEADIRAVNNRLRLLAAHEKQTEELAKAKAAKAAAALTEKEGGKAEKPKKAPEPAKEKKEKAKPEKKPALL